MNIVLAPCFYPSGDGLWWLKFEKTSFPALQGREQVPVFKDLTDHLARQRRTAWLGSCGLTILVSGFEAPKHINK
jgi:hypothetical protein